MAQLDSHPTHSSEFLQAPLASSGCLRQVGHERHEGDAPQTLQE